MMQTFAGLFRAKARRLLAAAPTPQPQYMLPSHATRDEAYLRSLLESFRSKDSWIYVDTSVLMWLTQVGGGARTQFEDWIEANASGRCCVPVWAAHEFQTHVSRKRLIHSLSRCTDELERTGGRLYAELHPFLQVPLETAADVGQQQNEYLDALSKVRQLGTRLNNWKNSYEDSVDAVRRWVNAHAARGSKVLQHAVSVGESGPSRYENRVPPGFQDRRKKERHFTEDEDSVSQGSNKWGDLIFWLEVVELSKKTKTKTIIVLTDDGKNDWRMPGSDGANAHPMLAFEAALEAGALDLKLVDMETLARALTLVAEPHTEGLRRAAITPEPAVALTPRRAAKAERKGLMRSFAGAAGQHDPSDIGLPTSDDTLVLRSPPNLVMGAVALRTAIKASAGRSSELGEGLAQACIAELQKLNGVVDVLLEWDFSGCNAKDLVYGARQLHDKVNTDPSVLAPKLLELIGILSKIPQDVSACLLAGLLASAYFEPGSTTARKVPVSPALEQLFEQYDKPFARSAVDGLNERLRTQGARLLYWPSPNEARLDFQIRVRDGGDKVCLDGISVGQTSVFEPAQGYENLQLVELVGATTATADDVMDAVCKTYGIPKGLLRPMEFGAENISLESTDGLVDPARLPMQEEK